MQEMASFYLLKDELLSRYQETYPSWQGTIHDFKTREIANFQELLEKAVGSRVSEKWFYTHIKPQENKKLPRIDTLDILSAFVGYDNWEAFVYEQSQSRRNEKAVASGTNRPLVSKKTIGYAITLLVLILGFNFLLPSKKSYTICFVDADNGKPIAEKVEVSLLNKGESPLTLTANKKACVVFEEVQWPIQFTVNAPYYRSDTITRSYQKKRKKEQIKLYKDDFALMIHLFSNNQVKEWQKRREQLNQMFDDNAVIFQVNKNNMGLEMYNKTKFIDKLTMPINSLKNIRIVDVQYEEGRIVEMRFVE